MKINLKHNVKGEMFFYVKLWTVKYILILEVGVECVLIFKE